MSADRTQHVLDAIDGALDDWTVSDDAMRWTPEVKPPRQQGRGVWFAPAGTVPPMVIGETHVWRQQQEAILRRLMSRSIWFHPEGGEQVDLTPHVVPVVSFQSNSAPTLEAFEAARRQFVETMSRVTEQFAAMPVPVRDELVRRINALQGVTPDDEDPRARALRLRKERNTGPPRDLVRQRRPRQLP